MQYNKNNLYYILLFIGGLIFYILNYYTPFMHDDYAYCFFYDNNSELIRPTSTPVTSLSQLIESQFNHYCDVNGRFSSHVLIQLFCSLLGKSCFHYINTLIFILLLHTIVQIICSKKSIPTLLIIYFTLLYIIPFPGQTMLWLTGSINYLWTTTFTLIYLRYLTTPNCIRNNLFNYIIVFFFGLSIGWMNESINIGVTGGLFFYFLLNKSFFKGIVKYAYIGYALGTILIIFSPGTWARIEHQEPHTQLEIIPYICSRIIKFSIHCIQTILPFSAFIIYIIYYHYKKTHFINQLYLFILITTSLFLITLNMPEDRIFFGLSIFSLIFIISFFYNCINKYLYNYKKTIILTFTIINILVAYIGINKTYSFSQYNKYITQQIINAPSQCIIENDVTPIENRFCYITTISPDTHNFHNRVRAFYYQKKSIQALPSFLYKKYQETNLLNNSTIVKTYVPDSLKHIIIYEYPNEPYWIIPIEENLLIKEHINVKYTHLTTHNNLKKYQKYIRYLLGTSDIKYSIGFCYYILHKEQYYIVIPHKDNIEHFTIPFNIEGTRKDIKFNLKS